MSSSLKVAAFSEDPVEVTPHLMPFHISYTGPAPISTYFRVHPAPKPTFGRDETLPPTSSESQDTVSSEATLVNAQSSGADAKEVEEKQEPASSSHFVAAFRGRSMHGTKVDLPAGYAGIVLRAPDDKDSKNARVQERREEERTKSKGRQTRRSKAVPEVIEVEDDAMDASDASIEPPARVLQPTATFSSFVLWNPDIPVDEGRDEYLRSLSEWTTLATEIHRMED